MSSELAGADLLLEWCSIRGEGGRADFDNACLATMGPGVRPSAVVGRLEQLGHVDVNWARGRRWWVTPPLVVVAAGSGGRAFAVGARSSEMRAKLLDARAQDRIPSFEIVPQDVGAPASWYLGFRETSELIDAAELIGATVVSSVGLLYEQHFGSLTDLLGHSQREFKPSGFEAEVLDPLSLFFERSAQPGQIEGPGCFRQPTHGSHRYYFVDDAGNTFSPDRWTAVHAELGRRRQHELPEASVLEYDRAAQRMAVSANAQLPLPWARVAVAASGRLPRRVTDRAGTMVDIYDGIEPLLYNRIRKALDAPVVSMRKDLLGAS